MGCTDEFSGDLHCRQGRSNPGRRELEESSTRNELVSDALGLSATGPGRRAVIPQVYFSRPTINTVAIIP